MLKTCLATSIQRNQEEKTLNLSLTGFEHACLGLVGNPTVNVHIGCIRGVSTFFLTHLRITVNHVAQVFVDKAGCCDVHAV